MPWSANDLLSFGLASALIAGGAQPAWSQGLEKTISITKAFEPDLAELKPGVVGQFNAVPKAVAMPGMCNKGPVTKTVVGRGGDPLFLETLGNARTEALDEVMRGNGHLMFATEWVHGSIKEDGNVEVRWDALPDKQNPKLHTDSNPKKGTKVQADKKIEVTMTAKDDANLWQSGIHIIQLTGEPGGLVKQDVYGRELRCQPATLRPPPLKGTYTVPPNPPPIVRLRATAEDFAGNSDFDVGEFPTGDWYGRILVDQKGVAAPPASGESLYRYSVDLALDYDDKGNLTGSALGSATFKSFGHGPPPGCITDETEETVQPAKVQGQLAGSYTPGRNAISIQVKDEQSTPIKVKWQLTRKCRVGGTTSEGGTRDRSGDMSLEALVGLLNHNAQPAAAGGVEYWLDTPDGSGGYTRIRGWLRQAEK